MLSKNVITAAGDATATADVVAPCPLPILFDYAQRIA